MHNTASSSTYAFVGNRMFVLDAMLRMGLVVNSIFAVRGSHLERQLASSGKTFVAFDTKQEIVEALARTTFDILISNGCPFILPVNRLREGNRVLVNIHPSYLPDLRGRDPVPGALLFRRDSGATCHVIDEGIDTGDLIARVLIPFSEDLDAGLLYQLTFWAEQEAFAAAFDRNFAPIEHQSSGASDIYYSRKASDQVVDLQGDDRELIIRKIRAFGNRSQGVTFSIGGSTFKAYDAESLHNAYLLTRLHEYTEGEVVFCYEDVLVLRKGDGFLKLKRVAGPVELVRAHDLGGV